MTLKKLNRSTVLSTARPIKVVQFGEGNFLRAFVDWMIDRMNEKSGFNGNVQIVQPLDQGMGELVNRQEGLYHVVLEGIKNGKPYNETRLITCVESVLNPYADFDGYLDLADNPDLEFIISNTTEAGIAFDENDTDPAVISNSFPGKLTSFLSRRFTTFEGDPEKALTIIPCELIDKNGEKLREIILEYARLWNLSDSFAEWITSKTIFCNTLVDRIVPGFPRETIKDIQQEIGFDDNLVVKAEPFHLWVIQPNIPSGKKNDIEKRFPAVQADLEVKFVKDQTPYRTRKVRILNGAHTAMVPIAWLYGLRTVREAVEDTMVGTFIKEAIYNEIIPTLDLPKEELEQFAFDVIERFQNPSIKHELISIALNSISKFKVRVLPSILAYIERKNQQPERLVMSLAALIYFYSGKWNGEEISLNDTPEVLEFTKDAWQDGNPERAAKKILGNSSFWGQDLTSIDGLLSEVVEKMGELASIANSKHR